MPRKRKSSGVAEEDNLLDHGGSPRRSLYDILQVDRSASQVEIKKAYHRMALKLHPDKNPGDEEATNKFQSLQRVFGILGHPEKRKVYDETGSIEDLELTDEKFRDLYSYYRALYKKLSEDDIEAAELEYRGSEEEARDLKELYKRFKGDMNMVFNWLMCSRPEVDSHRFMETANNAIAAGEMKEYKVFRKWAAETAKKPPPVDPLAKPRSTKQKASNQGGADLKALISSRQQQRSDDLFAELEAKYSGRQKKSSNSGRRGGTAAAEEPSEEEFQAAQSRVLQGGLLKKVKQRASRG